MVERDHQVLYPSLLCDIPLVRGDCDYVALCLSLICEVDHYLAKCHPSKCRGDLFCALPLVRGCIVERGIMYS